MCPLRGTQELRPRECRRRPRRPPRSPPRATTRTASGLSKPSTATSRWSTSPRKRRVSTRAGQVIALRHEPDRMRPDADDDLRAFRDALRRKTPERRIDRAARDPALDLGKVAEKSGRKEARRPAIELLAGADLHDGARAHQHDPVGDSHRILRVMRDDDRGRAGFLQQRRRFVADHVAQPPVEIRERLVHQQHAGTRRHRPRQRHALLLAAGQHMRIGLGEIGKADPRDRPHRGGIGGGVVIAAQPEADILAHAQMREQRVILEDEADAAMLRLDEALGRGDILALQQHAARARPLDAGGEPEQRRLAAARLAEQRDDLAGLDGERHLAQRRDRAEALRHAVEGERHRDRGAGRAAPAPSEPACGGFARCQEMLQILRQPPPSSRTSRAAAPIRDPS